MGRGSNAPSFFYEMELRTIKQGSGALPALFLGALIISGGGVRADDAIEAKAKICASCHGEQGGDHAPGAGQVHRRFG